MHHGEQELCQCPSFSLSPWRSVHTCRGVLHLVSTRQRIGKPALGIGIPQRNMDKRRDGNKSSPVTIQYGTTPRPRSSKGLWTRLTKPARSLSVPTPSCKTAGLSCVPADRLDSVASAEVGLLMLPSKSPICWTRLTRPSTASRIPNQGLTSGSLNTHTRHA